MKNVRTFGDPLERYTPVPECGCWLWDGNIESSGYGLVWNFELQRYRRASRLFYEAFIGPITDGLFVLHKCDVRLCVNPAHLFLGTHTDNARDAAKKGKRADKNGENNGRAKITYRQAVEIRSGYSSGMLQRELAAQYGVCYTSIGRIVRGQGWKPKA